MEEWQRRDRERRNDRKNGGMEVNIKSSEPKDNIGLGTSAISKAAGSVQTLLSNMESTLTN